MKILIIMNYLARYLSGMYVLYLFLYLYGSIVHLFSNRMNKCYFISYLNILSVREVLWYNYLLRICQFQSYIRDPTWISTPAVNVSSISVRERLWRRESRTNGRRIKLQWLKYISFEKLILFTCYQQLLFTFPPKNVKLC